MKTRGSGRLVALAVGLMLATGAILPARAQTFKVLYTFNGQDGLNPNAGLVRDDAGNLYGTTFDGGNLSCGPKGGGCGVVFKLTP